MILKHSDINEGLYTLFSFVFGCLISILSGYIGMKIATIGNLRTAVAAQSSLGKGFQLALNSGAVMGFALVSLAVLGFVLIYLFTRHFSPTSAAFVKIPPPTLLKSAIEEPPNPKPAITSKRIWASAVGKKWRVNR